MRFLRFLRIPLVILGVFAALGILVVISPVGQTWLTKRWLERLPGVHATMEEASAGFSCVTSTNMRLEFAGGVLTAPAVEAEFPLKLAIWDRRWRISKLVAKGWTLELTPRAAAGDKETPTTPASIRLPTKAGADSVTDREALVRVAKAFRELLGKVHFPADVSVEGVALEGSVRMPTDFGAATVKIVVEGGGLAVGRTADLALEASGVLPVSPSSARDFAVKGRVAVELAPSQSIARFSYDGALHSIDARLPADLTVKFAAERARGETYTLALAQQKRALAEFRASMGTNRRWAGSWQLNLREPDLAPLSSLRWPADIALSGDGRFDANAVLSEIHVVGHATGLSSQWKTIDPLLNGLGAATLAADFDVTRDAGTLRIDQLKATVSGTVPFAVATLRQTIRVSEKMGKINEGTLEGDWLGVVLKEFPLTALPEWIRGMTITEGHASGELVASSSRDALTIKSAAPLALAHLAIARNGQRVLQQVDGSVALRIERTTARGWRVQTAPLLLQAGERRLATFDGAFARVSERDARLAIDGTWQADLEAVATLPDFRDMHWLRGRLAAGDLAVKAGSAIELKSKFTVTGHDASHTLRAELDSYLDYRGGISFRAPVHLAVGTAASDLTLTGAWVPEKNGPRLDAELSAVKVAFEHLSLLAGTPPMSLGQAISQLTAHAEKQTRISEAKREGSPFWGDLHGSLKLDCYEMTAGTRDFFGVGGTLLCDKQGLRLEGGRATQVPPPPARKKNARAEEPLAPPRTEFTLGGTLAFDAAAAQPYRLEAKATADPIDAAMLFSGAEPVIEGRFATIATLSGQGVDARNAVVQSRAQFEFSSKSSVVRLLRANVAEAFSADSTASSEALERVSSVVGAVLGRPRGITTGEVKVSKTTDAVLNFSYQLREILCDEVKLQGTRAADGTIQLDRLEMRSPQMHLVGTGVIPIASGQPLAARPLSLELRLGFQGVMAARLSTAGLLAGDKDPQGYSPLRQPIHFGGTLRQIDTSQWRDLLVAAAKPAPEVPKR